MDYIELSVKYAYSQSLKLITGGDLLIAVVMFLIVFGCGLCYSRYKRNNEEKEKRLIWFSLLIPYIYLVLAFTVINRPELSARMMEFIPFWTIQEVLKSGKKVLLLECFLNILMLIPFGFILKKLNLRFFYTLILGAFFSYTIEFSQLLTQRGLFELFDDPFHNILGVVIGYLICRKMTAR